MLLKGAIKEVMSEGVFIVLTYHQILRTVKEMYDNLNENLWFELRCELSFYVFRSGISL